MPSITACENKVHDKKGVHCRRIHIQILLRVPFKTPNTKQNETQSVGLTETLHMAAI